MFSIGSNVYFGFLNPNSEVILESPIIFANNVRLDCEYVGAYSFINENVTIRYTEKIGRFSSIAPNAYIGMVDHPVNSLTTSDVFYGKAKWEQFGDEYNYHDRFNVNNKSKVVIGNDVWIGMNVLVKRGVTIADGTIVAAGTVVTKDTSPYEIVGGVPARHIRYRFDEKTIEALMKSKWWEYDISVWNDRCISEASLETVEGVNDSCKKMNRTSIKLLPSENRFEFF